MSFPLNDCNYIWENAFPNGLNVECHTMIFNDMECAVTKHPRNFKTDIHTSSDEMVQMLRTCQAISRPRDQISVDLLFSKRTLQILVQTILLYITQQRRTNFFIGLFQNHQQL
jgi:hypothetical protein